MYMHLGHCLFHRLQKRQIGVSVVGSVDRPDADFSRAARGGSRTRRATSSRLDIIGGAAQRRMAAALGEAQNAHLNVQTLV